MKSNDKREDKYRSIISDLTQSLAIVKSVDDKVEKILKEQRKEE